MQDRGKLSLGTAVILLGLYRLLYYSFAGIESLASSSWAGQWLGLMPRYQLLASLFLLIVTGLFSLILCNQYILLHERGRVLFTIFFFGIAGTRGSFIALEAYVPALLLIVLALYRIFSCYDSSGRSRFASEAGISLGFACILWAPTLYLLPLFLLILYQLKAFSPKQLLAFLLGFLVPAWIVLPGLYFLGGEAYIQSKLQAIIDFRFHLSNLRLAQIGFPIALLILLGIGSLYMRFNYWSEKVFTRSLFHSISLTAYYLLILSMFLPQAFEGLLYMAVWPISILFTKSVLRIKWKRRSFLFLAIVLVFVLIEWSSRQAIPM